MWFRLRLFAKWGKSRVRHRTVSPRSKNKHLQLTTCCWQHCSYCKHKGQVCDRTQSCRCISFSNHHCQKLRGFFLWPKPKVYRPYFNWNPIWAHRTKNQWKQTPPNQTEVSENASTNRQKSERWTNGHRQRRRGEFASHECELESVLRIWVAFADSFRRIDASISRRSPASACAHSTSDPERTQNNDKTSALVMVGNVEWLTGARRLPAGMPQLLLLLFF